MEFQTKQIKAEEEAARKAYEERMGKCVVCGARRKRLEVYRLWLCEKCGQYESTNTLGTRMRLIQPGEFVMGDKSWGPSKPLHRVRITKPFFLGVYQVTQREWEKVMGSNPSNFKGEDLPVESVSWEDCQVFIKKLAALEPGVKYRLPTEAEWEYACRAGSTGNFCFGDDEARLGEYAWYSGNSDNKTHPVGEKKPNAWGLYDIHGNVWEWCWNWWDDKYYERCAKQGVVADPSGPETGSSRLYRGGSWDYDAVDCGSGYRYWDEPVMRWYYLGLRLARSV